MSAIKTIFYQECPTCGRSLRIPVKYFGMAMSCSHCSGEFVAHPELYPDGEQRKAPSMNAAVEAVELAPVATTRSCAS